MATKHTQRKLTEGNLVAIGQRYIAGDRVIDIARDFNVHRMTINAIRKRLGIPERRSERRIKAIASDAAFEAARKRLAKQGSEK